MLAILARASIDGAVFAALVWALTRMLPRLSPGAKTCLWWCATAKFAVALVWTSPVPLRLLPAEPAPTVVSASASAAEIPRIESRLARSIVWLPPSRGSTPASQLSTLVVGLWSAGVLLSVAIGARRWQRVRREIRASREAPGDVQAMAAEIAGRLGLSHAPRVRLSSTTGTPLVAGFVRPTIVVPAARFERLGADRQRMTLCHELAHVKRRDLWFGFAAAIAERAFFFHPLAHAAAREYVFWREAACDALVLDTLGATPHEYGRLLLDFGVSAPRRTLAAAGAAWSFSNLKRRIVMLRPPSRPSTASRVLAASALTLAAAGIVPVTLAARPPAPAPDPPPALTALAAPALDVVLPAPADRQDPVVRERKRDELAFVMFTDDGEAVMSGSADDMTRARQLRRGREPMLWVRRLGAEYIIRDEATMQELRRIWTPVGALGERQGAIGERQAALGSEQGAIGELQARLSAQQAAQSARQAEEASRAAAALAALESSLRTDAERAEHARKQREITSLMEASFRAQQALEAKLRELEQPNQALFDRLNALSQELEALSRGMNEETEKAATRTRALIDRAIANRLAEIIR